MGLRLDKPEKPTGTGFSIHLYFETTNQHKIYKEEKL